MTARAHLLPSPSPAGTRSRRTDPARVPLFVLVSWLALFVNGLAPGGNPTVLPIPRPLFQAVAQGSLVVALGFAMLANRRLVVRPNLFMVLLTTLAVSSLVVSLHNQFVVGSVFRGVRLLAFVACLWLLTPWWGRRDLVLLRAHRVAVWGVLALILAGAVMAPGKAFAFDGRLSGTLWPMPPTQVAHYAAVLFGTSVILWMCRVITSRHALGAVLVATIALVGTHTRTALLGAMIGVACASASLFLGHARVRRFSASAIVGAIAVAAVFAPDIVSWLARGQTAEDAAQLTGRTKVWSNVFATPRPAMESLFGSGLSNKSFEGLAIDSNWVASYVDQGWFGIVLQAAMLLLLLAMVATHVRGPRRAVALFLIVYNIISSITEVTIGDASPYVLDLVVAAALLSPRPAGPPRLRARDAVEPP